ncbi:dicarboxylate/amino acid:cation symporter [Belnapia mucosa]|uniref:dicarboxylate/amino acid:cation symporter n=1 Tax=Belnapia mucosa TaxID=2804532 RepID=UPI002E2CB4CA|nr:cation:dicarboxylase symporter family transporter [Belnapia mucosa]
MRSHRLTTFILIAMVFGIAVGHICHATWPDPATAKEIAGYISLVTDIFLRLIKMIIAPLVFSTLVVGVAHMGDTRAVGRIGGKAMAWFIGASVVSLLLGLVLVNLLRPGDSLNLPLPEAGASADVAVASLSLKDFVAHLVPRSIFEAMAQNEILQIVVFSLFFGVACAALGERARTLVAWIEELSHAILKVTGYIRTWRRSRSSPPWRRSSPPRASASWSPTGNSSPNSISASAFCGACWRRSASCSSAGGCSS